MRPMTSRAKKRVAFNATPQRVRELEARAQQLGLNRQQYMEMVLFNEVQPDGRSKASNPVNQEALPMTG